MIDIRRYDEADRLAMMQVAEWRAISRFRPTHFERENFPTRIGELGEIRYLFSLMNDARDAQNTIREMRGLREPDIEALARAAQRFIRFHAIYARSAEMRIPYTSLLYYYALHKKLCGLPSRASILDVGAGLGYLPFFLEDPLGVTAYNQIEVTQSLYVLQSSIGTHVFGEKFLDLADNTQDGGRAFDADSIPGPTLTGNTIKLRFTLSPQSTLFPWWKVHQAFEQKYDVIMSNENICEMDQYTFAYFAKNAVAALKPNGILYIQGFGKTTGDRQALMLDRFTILWRLGFRSLVSEAGHWNGGRLSRPHFLLVGPQHESYETAAQRIGDVNFDANNPIVRSIFGLDEPDGAVSDVPSLNRELRRRLSAVYESDA